MDLTNFLTSLTIMEKGMLGILIVMIILLIVIRLMTKYIR